MSVVNNKGERRITSIGCDSLSNRQVLSIAITPVNKKNRSSCFGFRDPPVGSNPEHTKCVL